MFQGVLRPSILSPPNPSSQIFSESGKRISLSLVCSLKSTSSPIFRRIPSSFFFFFFFFLCSQIFLPKPFFFFFPQHLPPRRQKLPPSPFFPPFPSNFFFFFFFFGGSESLSTQAMSSPSPNNLLIGQRETFSLVSSQTLSLPHFPQNLIKTLGR